MATFTLDTTGDHRINIAPNTIGPDGIAIQFDEVGTISAVLKVNTAPPGAAVSLSSVAYLNSSYAVQSAGTAITADGLIYVPAATAAAGDLYLTLTVTSGYVVVTTLPAVYGGGGASGGSVPAGDVTAGTFGQFSGETGDYSFPHDVTVGDVLTADELVATTSITGTLVTAAQPNITSVGTLTSPVATRLNVGAAPAGAISDTTITKTVTAIADNVATTVLTVTIPNAAHSGILRVSAMGILGAGGAIGAGEAVASNSYDITFVRTAGVNAVADISTAYGVNAANVAGAATCTAELTVGSVSGAVGAVNTFAIQITVVKSGGSSDNHVAVLSATLLNSNATGITVA